jgi:uncharacterized protein (TIGR03435 family)
MSGIPPDTKQLLFTTHPAHFSATLRASAGERMKVFMIVLGMVLIVVAAAQTAQKPAFEVVSIKPNDSGDLRTTAARPLPARGTYKATNQSVKQLIRRAYHLKPFQLEGGPKWTDDLSGEKFDIDAKAAGPVSPDELMLMLQSLLEERFTLKYHRETRQLPIYALVVAKKGVRGPNLHEPNLSEPGLFPILGSVSGLNAANTTMQDLAWSLSSFTGDRFSLGSDSSHRSFCVHAGVYT